ncbi:MAG: RNA methyltransferase [Geobacteraceae bacterium]|nr:RNA methyltransferase [Geobacteraceae bacterium]
MEELKTENLTGAKLAVALLHYPVYDKNRRIVATAVTNLDLHDIARLARTFGLVRYYVVTPHPEQQELALRISRHWQEGWGAQYNPKRKAALDLMTVTASLEDALADMEREFGGPVRTIATGAKGSPRGISYGEMSGLLKKEGTNYLLLLGTGWGVTEDVLAGADYVLAPIIGRGEYNHLSVRSAASIIVDRLCGVK